MDNGPVFSRLLAVCVSLFIKTDTDTATCIKKSLDKPIPKIYLYRNRETVDSEVKVIVAPTESPVS